MASPSGDPRRSLLQLKTALEDFRVAQDARKELESLGNTATRKGEEIREELRLAQGKGEAFDAAEWNRRTLALPEERSISQIHENNREAAGKVMNCWDALHTALDSLRSEHTKHLFTALDSTGRELTESVTKRYIGLAELILDAQSGPRTKVQRRTRNSELPNLKATVRRLWNQPGDQSYREFCGRLDANKIGLPPTVGWKEHGTWRSAFKQASNAVIVWLCRAVRPTK
jgi:hypothetical protein